MVWGLKNLKNCVKNKALLKQRSREDFKENLFTPKENLSGFYLFSGVGINSLRMPGRGGRENRQQA